MAEQMDWDPFIGSSDDDEFDKGIKKLAGIRPIGKDYNPEVFYTTATNSHDHSMNVQTPFPKGVVMCIERAVGNDVFPDYTSRGAVIRDAVIHRLEQLADLAGDWELSEMLTVHKNMASAEWRRQQRDLLRQVVANAEKELVEMQREGDWESMDIELTALETTLDTYSGRVQRNLADVIARYRGIMERFAT